MKLIANLLLAVGLLGLAAPAFADDTLTDQLLNVFAQQAAIQSYYQNALANELYIPTAGTGISRLSTPAHP